MQAKFLSPVSPASEPGSTPALPRCRRCGAIITTLYSHLFPGMLGMCRTCNLRLDKIITRDWISGHYWLRDQVGALLRVQRENPAFGVTFVW